MRITQFHYKYCVLFWRKIVKIGMAKIFLKAQLLILSRAIIISNSDSCSIPVDGTCQSGFVLGTLRDRERPICQRRVEEGRKENSECSDFNCKVRCDEMSCQLSGWTDWSPCSRKCNGDKSTIWNILNYFFRTFLKNMSPFFEIQK